MAARAFIEKSDKTLRAVCRETGVKGAFVPESHEAGHAERHALAMLSEACDCDDYHSVMEGVMDKAADVSRQAIKDAIEAEMKKAEHQRQVAQQAAEAAKWALDHAEARKRELEAALAAGESIVGALEEAEVVATGVFSEAFSPTDHMRLELVQGLKENDSMRFCSPSIEDRRAPLVVRLLGDVAEKEKKDFRPVRDEWHVLVLMRRIKKADGKNGLDPKDRTAP